MQKENKKTLLITEDEPNLIFTLQDTLENEGYTILVADNGLTCIEMVKEKQPDLLLLDVMMPNMSGYEVCKTLRSMNYYFPIIMLTARNQEIDKVTGLNVGADDYITKPFGVKELLARVNAQLRRTAYYADGGHQKEPVRVKVDKVKLGNVEIDLANSVAIHPGREVELSSREVELIKYFLGHTNTPVSREELLTSVWKYEYSTNTRTVDVHMSKLRNKIEEDPKRPRTLVTLHGVGYIFKMSEPPAL